MLNTKKIWRDNTMPPTNYIWMRTNMRHELIGVFEWLNGHWHRIKLEVDGCETYSRAEVDYLLQYTEQEIIRKILDGEYSLCDFTIDDELSLISENAVQNKIVTEALEEKLDKTEFEELRDNLPELAGIRYGTTEYWNNQVGCIPKPGEIIIYSDYSTVLSNGQVINVPGIKIGSGNGYVQDLAFLDQDLADALYNHILNATIHVTAEDKERWNNKLNVDDDCEVSLETLIFNRN